MLLDELAALLQANGLGSTSGPSPTLLKNFMPDLPNEVVVLYEYPGEPGLFVKNSTDPVNEMPRCQVTTRAADFVTARVKAERIYRLLDGFAGYAGGVHYGSIRALQPPFFMTRDDKNRPMFVANYRARKELSPLA